MGWGNGIELGVLFESSMHNGWVSEYDDRSSGFKARGYGWRISIICMVAIWV